MSGTPLVLELAVRCTESARLEWMQLVVAQNGRGTLRRPPILRPTNTLCMPVLCTLVS
jgi:hypothetical protein